MELAEKKHKLTLLEKKELEFFKSEFGIEISKLNSDIKTTKNTLYL